MTQRLMILGAGVYQLPLIQKAKEMGVSSFVVSPRGDYPGIDLADTFVATDTTDIHGVLAAAREYRIDGILTTGSDVAVPTIGRVVDELALTGTGYASACRSMNKVLMKKCLDKGDVRTARFRSVSSPDELTAAAEEFEFPLMVKAADSSGSRGIVKVLDLLALEEAYLTASNVSRSGEVILEEFLDGYEIGAQAIVVNGEVIEIFIHADQMGGPAGTVPVGHSMPLELPKKTRASIEALVPKAVLALGIDNTISNIDLMIVDDEPYIIEVAARMGGTCLPELISIYDGFDVYEFAIRLALGERPQLPLVPVQKATAALLIQSSQSGIIQSIEVPQSVVTHPQLVRYSLDKQVGDRVNAFTVGPDRVGEVIVCGANRPDAEALVERLTGQIRIHVEAIEQMGI